jgi:hypothetical protein
MYVISMVYHTMLAFNVKHKGNPNKDWKPNNRKAYDRTPVQVKVLPGVRERLKTVDDWQNKLRRFIDELIEEDGD